MTFENEETHFRVLKVQVQGKGLITVVGKFPFVGTGATVHLTGEFANDAKHGEQFRVQSLVPIEPQTVAGIERYLASGIIPGIGPGFAKRIVAAFGDQTLKVLDEDCARLREVPGLGEGRCKEIQNKWAEQRALSSLGILLQTHGVGMHLVRKIIAKYGERASEIVQTAPYRLAMDVRGVGFRTADQLASSMGLAPDHPDRVKAGILHCLHQVSDSGHVYAPREQLCATSADMLGTSLPFVEAGLDALWGASRVVIECDKVYLPYLHSAEANVALAIARLSNGQCTPLEQVQEAMQAFEQERSLTLADAQRHAVTAAAANQLLVITGGPGVGKTTIVRAILSTFQRAKQTVALAAPTGRAAKRLSESTGLVAHTLHRLLEYDPRLNRFQRSADNPLPCELLIVDEASMIDLQLADSLLDALSPGARLILVGDSDQLPSVGPGAFLRDVIQCASAEVVRLNAVFRQSSSSYIVRNAHAILAGERPRTCERDTTAGDFFIVERRDGDKAAETIRELFVERIPKRFGLEPVRDVQVLSPMHRGPTGTQQLNALLQASLKRSGPSVERHGQAFRIGDRVMQLKNDYEREVFNGDIGFVDQIDAGCLELQVRFDERCVTYSDSDLEALTLAYATSIHKSQGSEYPAVIVPFLTAHFVMLSRNLLYTAVTRARRLCVLVADPRAIELALSELKREDRWTTLSERIAAARHQVLAL